MTPSPAKANAVARIAPVDGLRAVAVLGVLWAHCWLFTGNPPLRFASGLPDVNRLISILGTGVDLFFVISGFCMQWMYARKQQSFGWSPYLSFIKLRWLRIAPAYYASVFACACFVLWKGESLSWTSLLAHLGFYQNLVPGVQVLASPFWSLSTEWHYYLLLPLLVWLAARRGFWSMLIITASGCMALRIYVVTRTNAEWWLPQVPVRLIEFLWGMAVAKLYEQDQPLPTVLKGAVGIFVACLIAYAGRLLMMKEVMQALPFARAFAEPIMTFGYALLMWNVLTCETLFQRGLSSPALLLVGRWSYSLYLWHWWPCYFICGWCVARWGSTAFTHLLSLALSLLVLVPFCAWSYRCLEAPYFRRRHAA